MAYQQFTKYKDMVIAVNGVEVYHGDLIFPVVSDDTLTWVQSNYIGGGNVIYSRTNMSNPNANFAAMETGFTLASDELKGQWLFDHLTTNGDYIDIYNNKIGNIMSYRITRSGGGSNWLECYLSVVYPGGQVVTSRGYEIYAVYSNSTTTFIPFVFLDVDAKKGAIFRGNRFYRIPISIYDQWSLIQQPECTNPNYDSFVGGVIYSIFSGYDSGGGGGEPYIGGGTSTSGGGENATFDLSSDDIDIPTLPSISASGAGLLTLYQVSMQNMQDFASYLWSPLFDVDTLKKLFNDPMDAIISLGMLPFTPTGGTVSNIFIGESDSGVSATRLGSQYYELDMGSLTLDTFYDSALDLNPYTKVDLYLPYCGTVSINPDEFDGKSIHVIYHVDILTGACVVFVEDGSRVLVQSQGNILTAIPFTSKDFKSIFGAVLGDAAAAGAAIGALATGGISAVAGGIGLVSHVALNTVNSKVNTPHGGQCASTAGFLSVQKPYLIITRPAQCLPEDNASYQGYPAYITETVGNLSGFIKVSEAHFDGFTCTDGELKEIDRLLKEGVYVQ